MDSSSRKVACDPHTAALLARLDGGKALTVAGYAEALRACGDADAPDNALTGAIPVESARAAYNQCHNVWRN